MGNAGSKSRVFQALFAANSLFFLWSAYSFYGNPLKLLSAFTLERPISPTALDLASKLGVNFLPFACLAAFRAVGLQKSIEEGEKMQAQGLSSEGFEERKKYEMRFFDTFRTTELWALLMASAGSTFIDMSLTSQANWSQGLQAPMMLSGGVAAANAFALMYVWNKRGRIMDTQ